MIQDRLEFVEERIAGLMAISHDGTTFTANEQQEYAALVKERMRILNPELRKVALARTTTEAQEIEPYDAGDMETGQPVVIQQGGPTWSLLWLCCTIGILIGFIVGYLAPVVIH
jgi:hypothetical protein